MNKLFVYAALMLAAYSCAPKSYTIEGVVPDAMFNDQMVYLYDYETRKNTDSALVSDGKFIFKGLVDTAVIRRIVLNRLYVNLILENGKISVDMANPESVKGTPLNNQLSKLLSELDNDLNIDLFSDFFNANKNNALGTFSLLLWSNFLTPDKFDSLYMEAGDVVRNYKLLKDIIEANEKIKKTAAGMMFTDFTIVNGNRDGSSVSFSDYIGNGKYVLVDFWASWCGPCIAEIPLLKDIYNQYNGDKFEILGVAVWDRREETLKSIDNHKIPWSQIIEANNIPTDLYGINGIPQIMLFDPQGKIVARDLRGNILRAKVAEVMQ